MRVVEPWKLEPARDHGLPPAERARSLKRENSLLESITHGAWSLGMRAYLRTYHRLRIVGAEHIPERPPFVLIGNHASHLDALVLAAALPVRLCDRVFPIAAGDVFFQTDPLAILAAGFINALPMWRKNCGAHALEQLRERLVGEPCAFILFPEGARARDGTLKPFKSGLGMIVAGTPVPVVPCAIRGAFEALGPARSWPRPRRIELRIGAAMRFDGLAAERGGWDEVALRARDAVERLMRDQSQDSGAAGAAAIADGVRGDAAQQ
jgi:1-acyl-sn-glycerol-3-phosphate acyltransferase